MGIGGSDDATGTPERGEDLMSTGTEQAQAAAAPPRRPIEAPEPARPGDRGDPAAESETEQERAKDYFRQFLDQAVKPGQVVSKDVETNIKSWIGEIDKKLSAQLNEIMHDPAFQKLESTWRGLHYLVQPDPRRARRSRSGCSTSRSRSCSRTWRRPSSSTRARCSRRSTRRSTASSAASRTACWSATTSSAATPRTSACSR